MSTGSPEPDAVALLVARLKELESEAEHPAPWSIEEIEPYELRIHCKPGDPVARVFLDDAPVYDYNDRQRHYGKLLVESRNVLPALLAIVEEQQELIRAIAAGNAFEDAFEVAAVRCLARVQEMAAGVQK